MGGNSAIDATKSNNSYSPQAVRELSTEFQRLANVDTNNSASTQRIDRLSSSAESPTIATFKVSIPPTPSQSFSTSSQSISSTPVSTINKQSGNITNPEAKVMSFFQAKGYTKEQASAIAGNLKVESDFKIGAIGDTDTAHHAYGIAQWRDDRRAKFQEVFHKPIEGSSFEEQLAYIDWELNNTEKTAGDKFKATTTVSEAASVFDQYYERSSGEHRGRRISESERIANA